MQIKDTTLDAMYKALEYTNRETGFELEFVAEPRRINARGTSFQFRLRAINSHANGARHSWSGRRTVSACWHAHRDFFYVMFRFSPNAVIKTMMATYTAENFDQTYPPTGDVNIGSQMQPAYMPDLCDCNPKPLNLTKVDVPGVY